MYVCLNGLCGNELNFLDWFTWKRFHGKKKPRGQRRVLDSHGKGDIRLNHVKTWKLMLWKSNAIGHNKK